MNTLMTIQGACDFFAYFRRFFFVYKHMWGAEKIAVSQNYPQSSTAFIPYAAWGCVRTEYINSYTNSSHADFTVASDSGIILTYRAILRHVHLFVDK